MFCRNCGRKLDKKARFCPGCGAMITGNGKKRRWAFLVGLAVLLIICAVCSIIFFYNGNSADYYIGTVQGKTLTDEKAEQILLSDISDKEWKIFDKANEELCQIVGGYSNADGYIEPDNTTEVLNDVAAKIDALYKDGIVDYYACDENEINFEYAFGVTGHYSPDLEGTSSGGGNVNILSIDPFGNDDSNQTMTNMAYRCGKKILEVFPDSSFESYANEKVTLDALKNLPISEFFLWNGHGSTYTNALNTLYPTLLTRQPTSDRSGTSFFLSTVREVGAEIEEGGSYWAITPQFIEKYMSLGQGLVYLSTCQSGRNNTLAAAFANIGAEVIFVNVGEKNVRSAYSQNMMDMILSLMAGNQDGIFHTADEALDMANSAFSQAFLDSGGITMKDGPSYATFEDYKNGEQGGTHVEVRGAGNYTLCSCVRGEITFEDGLTASEIANIRERLSIELIAENKEVAASTTLSSTEFYFNNLDPGTYQLRLFEDGKLIYQNPKIIVKEHRYTPVEAPYAALVSLEGYVYDENGLPISGVSVAADMVEASDMWSEETSTDETGHYQLDAFGVNSYKLSYNASGYLPQEQSVTINENMYENAQAGGVVELADMILKQTKTTGTVVDAETGKPLSGVTILIGKNFWKSNESGAFDFHIKESGSCVLTFALEGYENITVECEVSDFANTEIGTIALAPQKKLFDSSNVPTGAVSFNGHHYYVYELDTVTTWEEAKKYCEEQGGYLATITSSEENDFVYSCIKNNFGYESAYFGFSDQKEEGTWLWSNGETSFYTNWHSEEPNDENPNEDYAMYYYKYLDGTWNDGDFGQQTLNGGKAFICEWGE